jgi:hypothetical protein
VAWQKKAPLLKRGKLCVDGASSSRCSAAPLHGRSRRVRSNRIRLERSREKVGVDPNELRTVFATALVRAGTSLDAAETA